MKFEYYKKERIVVNLRPLIVVVGLVGLALILTSKKRKKPWSK